jgi:hypothetical protein
MLMLQKLMATTATVAFVFACTQAPGPAAAGSDESTPGAYHDLPRVSAATPFLADCNGPDFPITAAYINAESEPYIAVNPRNPDNLINVFSELPTGRQSDRSSHRILAIRSTDSGLTWSKPMTVATAAVAGIVDPRTGAKVRTGNSFTDIAVDPRPGTNTW